MFGKKKKIDLLAIGDTTIDAFIRIKDAHIHCNLDKEGCELCLRFGDKIPYESVTVLPAAGNSANVAVTASRLGLKTALLANIGSDENGENCAKKLIEEKICTDFIKIEENKKTNYHYILWYDTERTILTKHEKYERTWPNTKKSRKYAPPKWIYLSSIGENSFNFYNELIHYLEKHLEVKLAFQPGTYQISLGTKELKNIYARTEVFFCNLEEAKKILGAEKEIIDLAKGIEALGPKMVVITDGSNGAYFYKDAEFYFLPSFGVEKPLERTGAGDALAGTFVSAIILGKSPLEAFTWGPVNSSSVIRKIGAQEGLLNREKLEGLLSKRPDYKPKKIN